MSEPPLEARQLSVLEIFGRVKGQKLAASDLKGRLATARAAGLGADAEADSRAIARLVDEELIALEGRTPDRDAPHPRPKASYRLTASGRDLLKSHGRTIAGEPRAIAPTHDSAPLLACQKAYLLLQLLRRDDRSLARSALNDRLRTKAAQESLSFDPPTIDWVLSLVTEQGYVTERPQGGGKAYRLTDDGVQYLAATEQYPTARFTLTGAELNALIAAVRESIPTAEPERTNGQAATPPVPARSFDGEALFRVVQELRRGPFANADLIPIYEVRRRVKEIYGPAAAGHEVFDGEIRRLRSVGRVRMIAISDLRDATAEQLDESISGMNETLFYLVAGHEPARAH